MAKRTVFFLMGFFFSFCAVAQKDFEYVDSTLLYDKTEKPSETTGDHNTEDTKDIIGDTIVQIRSIDLPADTLEAWKLKKEYAYAKNLDSMLAELQRQKEKSSTYTRSSSPSFLARLFNSTLAQCILWLIAGAFVCYIIYQLFLSKGAFSRRSKSSAVNVNVTEDELFLQQDFDALIHQSCKLGDYRLATRYLFLKVLQHLSDRSLISFAIDKTNSKYVYEIPADKRNDFSALVMNYEYVWYGNFNIDKELYTKIETKFSSFLNRA